MSRIGDRDALKSAIKQGDWNQLHVIAKGNMVLVLFVAGGVRVDAQKLSAADLAARMTGSWIINLALSPSFRRLTAVDAAPGSLIAVLHWL